jgi:hypothetical protein
MPNSRISMTNLKRLVELQSSNLTVREAAAALSMSSWRGVEVPDGDPRGGADGAGMASRP